MAPSIIFIPSHATATRLGLGFRVRGQVSGSGLGLGFSLEGFDIYIAGILLIVLKVCLNFFGLTISDLNYLDLRCFSYFLCQHHVKRLI